MLKWNEMKSGTTVAVDIVPNGRLIKLLCIHVEQTCHQMPDFQHNYFQLIKCMIALCLHSFR